MILDTIRAKGERNEQKIIYYNDELRDEIYGFMCRTAADSENYAHITYIKSE